MVDKWAVNIPMKITKDQNHGKDQMRKCFIQLILECNLEKKEQGLDLTIIY